MSVETFAQTGFERKSPGPFHEFEVYVATIDDSVTNFNEVPAESTDGNPTAAYIDRDSVELINRRAYWAGVLDTARNEG